MDLRELLDTYGPLGVTWFQWLLLLGIVVIGYIFGKLGGEAAKAILARIVRRTHSTWDDAFLKRLSGPISAALGLAFASALVPFTGIPDSADDFIYQVVRASYGFVFFWALFRIVDVGFHLLSDSMWARSGPSRSLIPLGSRVAKFAILAIATVAVLSDLGYPVASLIAGLGIGGLALALAAQKTVENLFGAFSIGVDQPFRVGDFVKVEDFQATVERIGLRSTRFRTLERTIVTMPNGRLADTRIETFAVRDRMRFATIIGLVYGTSESQLRQVIEGFERVLRGQPKLFPEGMAVTLRALGASAIDIEVACWFATENYGEFQVIRQEVLLQFLRVVEEAGTSLAFPTQTLHLVPPETTRQDPRTAQPK